jgi:hypothetical protein
VTSRAVPLWLPLFVCAACAACGGGSDDAGTAIAVPFRVQSNSVDGDGTAVDSKGAGDVEGDPWNAFIAGARAELGGDPSALELTGAAIALAPTSTGVDDFGQVFRGPVAVYFEMTGSNRDYPIAEVILSGDMLGTESALSPRFRWTDVSETDRTGLLDGELRFVFVGQTDDDFRDLDAGADLDVTLVFRAIP